MQQSYCIHAIDVKEISHDGFVGWMSKASITHPQRIRLGKRKKEQYRKRRKNEKMRATFQSDKL